MYSGASYLVSLPKIRQYCLQLLQKNEGTRLNNLLEKLDDKTNCSKVITSGKKLVEVPDNNVQLDATKTLLKLYGLLDSNKNINVDQKSLTVNVTGNDVTRLNNIINDLHNLNNQMLNGKKLLPPD